MYAASWPDRWNVRHISDIELGAADVALECAMPDTVGRADRKVAHTMVSAEIVARTAQWQNVIGSIWGQDCVIITSDYVRTEDNRVHVLQQAHSAKFEIVCWQPWSAAHWTVWAQIVRAISRYADNVTRMCALPSIQAVGVSIGEANSTVVLHFIRERKIRA
jgi:hypothetical protein